MESSLRTKRIGRRPVLGALAATAALGWSGRAVAAGTRTVRFAFFGTPGELQSYQLLIDAFETAHPTIAIERLASPQTTVSPSGIPQGPYMDWLATSFVGAQPPDVFLLSYRQFGYYAARGVIEPLGPYLRASKSIQEVDFYPSALDAFRLPDFPGDGLGAIPQNTSSLAVFYNQDLFSKAHVPVPEAGWTWDDFTAAATKLTSAPDGNGRVNVYGLVIEPTIARYAPFVWGAGGELFDSLHNPTRLTIDSHSAQRGLHWFTSLGQAGLKVTPSEAELRFQNDLDRFRAGKAAMLVQSRRAVPILRQTPGLTWDIAPLPIGQTPANVLHSDAFCLFPGATDKDAAWTFIEFANSPTGQRILAGTGRTVPSLRSVAESDAFLPNGDLGRLLGSGRIVVPPAHGQVFVDNVAIARRLPSAATWPAFEAAFNKAFRRAFYADSDIAAAVANATRGGLMEMLTLQPRADEEE